MSSGIKIVFGAASVGNPGNYESDEAAKELLQTLKECKVDTLDTAQLYGKSEEALGRQPARKDFIIDTKAFGGFKPQSSTKDPLVEEGQKSLKERLQISQVDIFYLHAPDESVPISDTLSGINELHKQGLFKRFGLSNYTAENVRKVHDHAKQHGYVLPTAYQGNYSPVARLQETELFPTLRELKISFYAYSPLAGGFLTKTKADIAEGKGRFDDKTPIGAMYKGLYGRPAYLEALAKWEEAAKAEGVSRAELAYRWVAYHSPLKSSQGDALIFGGRNLEQIRETTAGIAKGPLSDKAVKAVDDVWEDIKHEAPLDNYHSSFKQTLKEQ